MNADRELQRRIWRRWRRARGIESIDAERFALGGVPAVAEEIAGRLIILPSDPELSLIEFDQEFWEYFPNPSPDPVTGGITDFGRERRSLSDCAVLYDPDWRQSAAASSSYFALHRSGTLDLTFPENYAPRDGNKQKAFHLIRIVGWTWAAMVRYSEFCQKYEIQGPFEIVLALRETGGAALGGFAEGWRDPFRNGFEARDLPLCVEPHVLLRRELDAWPVGHEREEAFRFGSWIEDAWNHQKPRFIANRGEYEGRFDPRPYRH